MSTCQDLKALIRAQPKQDIADDFDVGFLQGNTVVSIRSEEDLSAVWGSIKNVTLWCDGLRSVLKATTGSHTRSLEVDSDDESEELGRKGKGKKKKNKQEEKVEMVESTMKEKH